MPEINISVRDKVAAQTGRAVMVCDNSDYVLMFDFDAEWAAYTTKTARFRWGGAYTDVVFDGDRCECPAIRDTALVRVGVYAGDLHTSTPAIVPCLPSILGGDGAPADPAPDVYDQLMERLNEIEAGGGGGIGYAIGDGLIVEGNTLRVDAANVVEADNTKPVTSAAVHVEVGNINALLATI